MQSEPRQTGAYQKDNKQLDNDLSVMEAFWISHAQIDDKICSFTRSQCIDYLESECGWSHKRAVQQTHEPNRGLFHRLKAEKIIGEETEIGEPPKAGQKATCQDYKWILLGAESMKIKIKKEAIQNAKEPKEIEGFLE